MAGKVKLTPLQIEVLKLIEGGKVSEHRFGYGAWRIWGANPTVVGRLVSMGFVAWGTIEGDDKPCFPTDAGRAALSQQTGSWETGNE